MSSTLQSCTKRSVRSSDKASSRCKRKRKNALVGSSGELDQLDSSSLEHDSNSTTLVIGESSLGEVGGVDLDGEKEVVDGDASLDLVEDSENDSRSVLERSSVVIGSLVDSSGKELSEGINNAGGGG